MKRYAIWKKPCAVLPGGQCLCGAGAAVAGQEPQQYVRGGRAVLSAAGEIGKEGPSDPPACGCRRGDHYGGGTGNRPAGESGLPCLGLPGQMGEFPRTDLPAIQYPLGTVVFRGHGPARMAGQTVLEGLEKAEKTAPGFRGVFVKQLILPMVYDHREDFSLFTGKAQYRAIYQPGCIEVRSYLFDKLEFGKLTFIQIIRSNINTLFVFKSKLYNPRH